MAVHQQPGEVVMGLWCRYAGFTTETGKLKMNGDVGVVVAVVAAVVDFGPSRGLTVAAASAAHDVARTCDSNWRSWPMKLKLGEMMLRRRRTNSKASSKRTRFLFIR